MYCPHMTNFSLNYIQDLDSEYSEYYLNGYTYFSPVDIYIKKEKYERCNIENIILIFNNLSLPLKIAKNTNGKLLNLINYDKSLIFIDSGNTFFTKFNKLYTLEVVNSSCIIPSWRNTSLYLSYMQSLSKCDKEIKDIINSYKLMEEFI